MFGRISHIKINVNKTMLVPLCSGDTWLGLSYFLQGPLSYWKAAKVVNEARYLGLIMGPLTSLDTQWAAAIGKYKDAGPGDLSNIWDSNGELWLITFTVFLYCLRPE